MGIVVTRYATRTTYYPEPDKWVFGLPIYSVDQFISKTMNMEPDFLNDWGLVFVQADPMRDCKEYAFKRDARIIKAYYKLLDGYWYFIKVLYYIGLITRGEGYIFTWRDRFKPFIWMGDTIKGGMKL